MAIIIKSKSRINKRPKKYYRLIVVVDEDPTNEVDSVKLKFVNPTEGKPRPNPSEMLLTKGKTKNGETTFQYKKLEFKGGDPVGVEYTIEATMKDASGGDIGTPETQPLTVEDSSGVNLSNISLKMNSSDSNFTFEAVFSGDINKIHSAAVNIVSTTKVPSPNPVDYALTVTKVSSIKKMSNSTVHFDSPELALYHTYLASISMLDASGNVIDYIEEDVVATD